MVKCQTVYRLAVLYFSTDFIKKNIFGEIFNIAFDKIVLVVLVVKIFFIILRRTMQNIGHFS